MLSIFQVLTTASLATHFLIIKAKPMPPSSTQPTLYSTCLSCGIKDQTTNPDDYVSAHNFYRSIYGLGPLVLNNDLVTSAQVTVGFESVFL